MARHLRVVTVPNSPEIEGRSMKRTLHVLPVLFLLGTALPAQIQPIQLRSGEVMLGRVTSLDEEEVHIDTRYPEAGQRTIPRDDLRPMSLWNILAARTDPKDGEAHLELARSARELGLPGQAIAALREAERFAPGLQAVVQEDIAELRDEMARQLLSETREALGDDREAAARLMVEAIRERYGDTSAAEKAAELREEMRTAAGGRELRELDADEMQDLLEDARGRLERVAAMNLPAAPMSVSDQRKLERVVALLEPVWRRVSTVTAAADANQQLEPLQQVQKQTKQQLVDAYVGVGSILAQRQAFPEAQDYAERACTVDPDGRGCHQLYRLIQLGRSIGW